MKITIEIPDEELKSMLEGIVEHFAGISKTQDKQEETESTIDLNKSLQDCNLERRAINALRSANIYSVADLVCCSKAYLQRIRNLGKHTLDRLEAFLCNNGLQFQYLPPQYRVERWYGTDYYVKDTTNRQRKIPCAIRDKAQAYLDDLIASGVDMDKWIRNLI